MRSSVYSYARAKSSPCFWCLRICTGLIFQQAALARPKGVQPVVSNHRLSAAFSFSRRLSPPKPFEPTSFQLVVVQSETGALLNSLVESLPTAQLLLLVNYRPE